MRAEMARMRKRAAEMEQRMIEELEQLRRSLGGELVPYGAYEPEPHRRRPGSDPGPDHAAASLSGSTQRPADGHLRRAEARQQPLGDRPRSSRSRPHRRATGR